MYDPDDWGAYRAATDAEAQAREANADRQRAAWEAQREADVLLRRNLTALREVEWTIRQHEIVRSAIRDRIGRIVAEHFQNRAALPGLGRVELRAPGVARVWDSGALSELAQSLREQGQTEIAEEIEACRKPQERAGGLAVKWEMAEGGEG